MDKNIFTTLYIYAAS